MFSEERDLRIIKHFKSVGALENVREDGEKNVVELLSSHCVFKGDMRNMSVIGEK